MRHSAEDDARYRTLERAWQDDVGHALLDKPFELEGSAAVFHRQFDRVIAQLDGLPPGAVLEIGCGKGQFLERLQASAAGAGRTLIGLELSKAVEAVRDAGFAAVKADGERLPLGDASVAAVVYQGALHHVIGYLEAVREALRVLVPGGRLVIFEPTTTPFSLLVHRLLDPIVFRTTCEYESPVDVHYKEHFSEAEVVREIERAGLRVWHERSDFLAYPFTGCYAGSWFARRPRVMRGLMRLERAVERAPALGRLARTFAWRFLLVAEKPRSR